MALMLGDRRKAPRTHERLKIGLFDWVEASDSRSPAEVYAHKLALAEVADKAGLHAFMLAEHQGTPLSIDGSPSLLLSAMIQRTRRLRVGALTFCLPWYDAFRFYNEVCMLDQLSGGRLELGVGRGVSPIESQIFGMRDIEHSRERYRETLEVFFEACKGDRLNFSGKYYQYKDVELYNKPVQRPYPPLWFPSSNQESAEFTARHGYNTAFLGPLAQCKPHFELYRKIWREHRESPGRHNASVPWPFLAKTQHLVIARDEDEAEDIGLRAYEKWASHIHHLTRKLGRPDVHKNDPYSADSAHRLITGSPRQVLDKLQEVHDITSANYLLCVFSYGDIAPEHAMRSLELFTRDVMPRLCA